MGEGRLSVLQYERMIAAAWRGGPIIQNHMSPAVAVGGRRSPAVEFVDEACILNTQNYISFQPTQITPPQVVESGNNGGLGKRLSKKYLKTETVFTDQQTICVVCQDNGVGEGEKIGVLNCKHEYHLSCIKVWLKEKNTCPLCNATAL